MIFTFISDKIVFAHCKVITLLYHYNNFSQTTTKQNCLKHCAVHFNFVSIWKWFMASCPVNCFKDSFIFQKIKKKQQIGNNSLHKRTPRTTATTSTKNWAHRKMGDPNLKRSKRYTHTNNRERNKRKGRHKIYIYWHKTLLFGIIKNNTTIENIQQTENWSSLSLLFLLRLTEWHTNTAQTQHPTKRQLALYCKDSNQEKRNGYGVQNITILQSFVRKRIERRMFGVKLSC